MILQKLKKRKINLRASMYLHKNKRKENFHFFLFRTCRLRKKAQHEANKLKLQGLNEEHS